MKTNRIVNLSRRRFLVTGVAAGAGLTLGLLPAGRAAMRASGPGVAGSAPAQAADFQPNAFLRFGRNNSVTVISKHLEMGQGTYTGMATLVAEELDADWEQVRVEGAPADAKRYRNLYWGEAQGTGGSTAIANSWTQMRQAGAAADGPLRVLEPSIEPSTTKLQALVDALNALKVDTQDIIDKTAEKYREAEARLTGR